MIYAYEGESFLLRSKDIFGKMKVRVVFFEEKDIFGKMKVKVVGFYAELQTLKVTLSVLSANKGRPRKQNLNVKFHILSTSQVPQLP